MTINGLTSAVWGYAAAGAGVAFGGPLLFGADAPAAFAAGLTLAIAATATHLIVRSERRARAFARTLDAEAGAPGIDVVGLAQMVDAQAAQLRDLRATLGDLIDVVARQQAQPAAAREPVRLAG